VSVAPETTSIFALPAFSASSRRIRLTRRDLRRRRRVLGRGDVGRPRADARQQRDDRGRRQRDRDGAARDAHPNASLTIWRERTPARRRLARIASVIRTGPQT
jgi:hypothetical protein